jgi:nicotinamidase/pyrazinamidase
MGRMALIVVDCQNDFASPDGALSISNAQNIMSGIARLIREAGQHPEDYVVVVTQDTHPENHCSFNENGGQWPKHCVEGTWGHEIDPAIDLATTEVNGNCLYFVHKANDPRKDAYSGFDGTGLAEILRNENVDEVFVCGLATDFCVFETVKSSLEEEFFTNVVIDLIKGAFPESSVDAIVEMSREGAVFIHSEELSF